MAKVKLKAVCLFLDGTVFPTRCEAVGNAIETILDSKTPEQGQCFADGSIRWISPKRECVTFKRAFVHESGLVIYIESARKEAPSHAEVYEETRRRTMEVFRRGLEAMDEDE